MSIFMSLLGSITGSLLANGTLKGNSLLRNIGYSLFMSVAATLNGGLAASPLEL